MGTSSSGHVWNVEAGAYGISSNKGYVVTTGGAAWIAGTALANSAQQDLTYNGNSATESVIIRLVDASNYLSVIIDATNIYLFKKVAGTFTQLGAFAAAGHTNGITYVIKAVINGTALEGWQDGTMRLTYTLTAGEQTTFLGATALGVGMRSSQTTVRFDNLVTT